MTAVPTAARTAVPMAARTAVPTAARTAEPTAGPDLRDTPRAGRRRPGITPGTAALRRLVVDRAGRRSARTSGTARLLLTRAERLPGRSPTCSTPRRSTSWSPAAGCARRSCGSPRTARTLAGPGVHRRRRGRCGRDRPGQRRRPGPALRRRGHAGAAGPAPHSGRRSSTSARTSRPSSATRCRSTPTSHRRSRRASRPLRRARRLRAAGRGREALAHPRARAPVAAALTSPGPTVAATSSAAARAEPCSTWCCDPGDCLYLPARLPARRDRARRREHPPDHRRPHLDAARPRRAAARRRARPPRRGRGGAGLAPARGRRRGRRRARRRPRGRARPPAARRAGGPGQRGRQPDGDPPPHLPARRAGRAAGPAADRHRPAATPC